MPRPPRRAGVAPRAMPFNVSLCRVCAHRVVPCADISLRRCGIVGRFRVCPGLSAYAGLFFSLHDVAPTYAIAGLSSRLSGPATTQVDTRVAASSRITMSIGWESRWDSTHPLRKNPANYLAADGGFLDAY